MRVFDSFHENGAIITLFLLV